MSGTISGPSALKNSRFAKHVEASLKLRTQTGMCFNATHNLDLTVGTFSTEIVHEFTLTANVEPFNKVFTIALHDVPNLDTMLHIRRNGAIIASGTVFDLTDREELDFAAVHPTTDYDQSNNTVWLSVFYITINDTISITFEEEVRNAVVALDDKVIVVTKARIRGDDWWRKSTTTANVHSGFDLAVTCNTIDADIINCTSQNTIIHMPMPIKEMMIGIYATVQRTAFTDMVPVNGGTHLASVFLDTSVQRDTGAVPEDYPVDIPVAVRPTHHAFPAVQLNVIPVAKSNLGKSNVMNHVWADSSSLGSIVSANNAMKTLCTSWETSGTWGSITVGNTSLKLSKDCVFNAPTIRAIINSPYFGRQDDTVDAGAVAIDVARLNDLLESTTIELSMPATNAIAFTHVGDGAPSMAYVPFPSTTDDINKQRVMNFVLSNWNTTVFPHNEEFWTAAYQPSLSLFTPSTNFFKSVEYALADMMSVVETSRSAEKQVPMVTTEVNAFAFTSVFIDRVTGVNIDMPSNIHVVRPLTNVFRSPPSVANHFLYSTILAAVLARVPETTFETYAVVNDKQLFTEAGLCSVTSSLFSHHGVAITLLPTEERIESVNLAKGSDTSPALPMTFNAAVPWARLVSLAAVTADVALKRTATKINFTAAPGKSVLRLETTSTTLMDYAALIKGHWVNTTMPLLQQTQEDKWFKPITDVKVVPKTPMVELLDMDHEIMKVVDTANTTAICTAVKDFVESNTVEYKEDADGEVELSKKEIAATARKWIEYRVRGGVSRPYLDQQLASFFAKHLFKTDYINTDVSETLQNLIDVVGTNIVDVTANNGKSVLDNIARAFRFVLTPTLYTSLLQIIQNTKLMNVDFYTMKVSYTTNDDSVLA